ncbi:hypothetical protein [Nonlabens ponticola]|uniref:Uncharacterized protein n=1 Tax=Nonlabens ponticola TaxID=2496866 RepID=A0A3S9MZB0_9FLAO|nr:hypothetical protein [Nonlabens ponticola]AZQ44479.1 hypothetical protein EJ995_09565 [Nonlabens ponticola]
MKKLILLILVSLLVSCEARLDNDKRGFFKTRVVNASGAPMDNLKVKLTTFRTNDFRFSNQNISKFSPADEDFLLGQGMTDANGEVSFLTLYDTNFRYYVTIEMSNEEVRVIEVDETSFDEDLTLEIEEIVIRKVSQIIIDFENVSGTTDPIEVRLNYFATFCNEFYINDEFVIDEFCEFSDESRVTINAENSDESTQLLAFFPSIISIDYTDTEGNDITQEFPVNNPEERYEINY